MQSAKESPKDIPQKQTPILYSFRRCPYAMRARMALLYSGIKYQLREVDLKSKPDAMLEASPKGTVPVLITAKGQVIDESMDIIDYAINLHDPLNITNLTKTKAEEVQHLITRNDKDFTPLLRRYKYFEQHPDTTKEETLGIIENNFLTIFEQKLSQDKFLIGEKISKADIAILPFMRQFALADEIWFANCPYKNIKRWLEGFINSNWHDDVMVRKQPWQQGDNPFVFSFKINLTELQ